MSHPACATVDTERIPYLLRRQTRYFSIPKSLQLPLKTRPYFKKLSPRSQIRDSGEILQRADIQYVTVFL